MLLEQAQSCSWERHAFALAEKRKVIRDNPESHGQVSSQKVPSVEDGRCRAGYEH